MQKSEPASLQRMLSPQRIAIVGASEKDPFLLSLIEDNLAAGAAVVPVNPRRPSVFGHATIAGLGDSPEPFDAVLALVGADATLAVAEEAAASGAGGLIVMAAQFAEVGEEGTRRQDALREIAAAGDLAVCGPNCLGLLNVNESIRLNAGPHLMPRPGSAALVTQSGGLWTSALWGASERMLGLSYVVSSGNEAVTDLVDYLEFLIDDPRTHSIGLVIEQIRRPQEFLAAARRALQAGKPIVAYKLGRSLAGQRVSASHTGALMQDATEYDAAFRQHGIAIADDLDDLLDVMQLFAQLPPEQWTTADRVAVLSASGGAASVAGDVFEGAGIELREDPEVTELVHRQVPGAPISNPLDFTGLNYRAEAIEGILDAYLGSQAFDTVVAITYLQEELGEFSDPVTSPIRKAAARTDKRLIVVSTSHSAVGEWAVRDLVEEGIGIGSGLKQTARSLAAMDRFVRMRDREFAERVAADAAPAATIEPVFVPGGRLLSFADGMDLLERFGLPVAPYGVCADPGLAVEEIVAALPSCERYVVKLADVLHRTEHGAVRTGIEVAGLREAIEALHAVADANGFSRRVVVQPQLEIDQELFIGVQGHSVFGPMVLVGIGGIFVDLLDDAAARVAPLSDFDAREMLDELEARDVLHGARGRAPVDIDGLVDLLVKVGDLAAAGSGWLQTLDINPLIFVDGGYAAVDVSCVIDDVEPSDDLEGG